MKTILFHNKKKLIKFEHGWVHRPFSFFYSSFTSFIVSTCRSLALCDFYLATRKSVRPCRLFWTIVWEGETLWSNLWKFNHANKRDISSAAIWCNKICKANDFHHFFLHGHCFSQIRSVFHKIPPKKRF